MGELREVYQAMKEHKKETREKAFVSNLETMKKEGFDFQEVGPFHFRFGEFDFWPSSGKWHDRKNNKRGLGLHSLLNRIRKSKGEP